MEIEELFNLKKETDQELTFEKSPNLVRHLSLRIGIFLAVLGLIFIGSAIIDDEYITLGSLIFAAGLTLVFMAFLLIEAIIFYIKKKNILANINMIIFGISVLIWAIGFFR